MPRVALTDRFCQSAKPLAARTGYFDVTVPGLALRVTEGGHKSWSYLFTSPRDGKRARATVGTYPATSLAAARTRALEARGHVEEGRCECRNDRGGSSRVIPGRPREGGLTQQARDRAPPAPERAA